jgi:hypothetical protein
MIEVQAATSEPHAPLVSIVTVFYNRVAYVRESIESLLAQTYPNIEIVAVDDGSTDGTGEALEAIRDPRLTVRRQANGGFVRAINAAVRASGGEYVAIHGSGDVSLPERVARQAEVLRTRPAIGVVACWWQDEDLHAGDVAARRYAADERFRDVVVRYNPLGHGEVMFRRALFDRVGGYREFFRFAQDHDLWIRMSMHCDYDIVREQLYRRRSIPGGVSASGEKVLQQFLFSDFAMHCGRCVRAGRPDPLDTLGPVAALMRPRSAAIASAMARAGARFLLSGRDEQGRALIAAALAEKATAQSVAAALLLWTSERPLLWRLSAAAGRTTGRLRRRLLRLPSDAGA